MTGGLVDTSTVLRIKDVAGAIEAAVSPLAGALRQLTVGGEDLVEPTVGTAGLPGMAGAVLAPWPNRVEDGTWWHEGALHELDVNEPELGNANHGLLSGRRFKLSRHDDSGAELVASLRRPHGYPFEIDVLVRYEVAAGSGLTVTTTVTNAGGSPAPVALGAHPYLRVGDAGVDGMTLTVDATHAYRLDDRHIPRERFEVGDSMWDLRQPTPVVNVPGHATLVREGGNGILTHRLTRTDGHGVELWADPDYRWTQIYRTDAFPAKDGPRPAVAVEPMTAPPNALRTGEGLRWLEPGESWRIAWGIRAIT